VVEVVAEDGHPQRVVLHLCEGRLLLEAQLRLLRLWLDARERAGAGRGRPLHAHELGGWLRSGETIGDQLSCSSSGSGLVLSGAV